MRYINDWNNNFFDAAFGLLNGLESGGSRPLAQQEAWFERRTADLPKADFWESSTHFVLSLDVPGFKKDDVSVEFLDGDRIEVKGERLLPEARAEAKAHLRERQSFKFHRQFQIPSAVEAEQIEAKVEDGVLCIALPKSKETSPRKINLGSSNEGFDFAKALGVSEDTESKKPSKN